MPSSVFSLLPNIILLYYEGGNNLQEEENRQNKTTTLSMGLSWQLSNEKGWAEQKNFPRPLACVAFTFAQGKGKVCTFTRLPKAWRGVTLFETNAEDFITFSCRMLYAHWSYYPSRLLLSSSSLSSCLSSSLSSSDMDSLSYLSLKRKSILREPSTSLSHTRTYSTTLTGRVLRHGHGAKQWHGHGRHPLTLALALCMCVLVY